MTTLEEIISRTQKWLDEQGCTKVHFMREVLPVFLIAERDRVLAEVEEEIQGRLDARVPIEWIEPLEDLRETT